MLELGDQVIAAGERVAVFHSSGNWDDIFGELLRRLPDIQAAEPSYVPGSFLHGVRSMPGTF